MKRRRADRSMWLAVTPNETRRISEVHDLEIIFRILGVLLTMAAVPLASAQDSQPWQQPSQQSPSYDGYGTRAAAARTMAMARAASGYGGQQGSAQPNDAYNPPAWKLAGATARAGRRLRRWATAPTP